MINNLINRFKQRRSRQYLTQVNEAGYAFVGIGQHSLTNIYPTLQHLQIPLKYICCTSEEKAQLINRKFTGVKATASLKDVLSDPTIKGVLVSASPKAHFSIAQQVLRAGKALYIEKPPCETAEQLQELIALSKGKTTCVGMQKRYAPAVKILRKRLKREQPINYDLHFLTGAYPEGDERLDLFIHPLDLVQHLFGPAQVMACQPLPGGGYLLMLKHEGIVGTLELSTHHTWTDMSESLTIRTQTGRYELSNMEELTYMPLPRTILGIPMEKVRPSAMRIEYLYHRNLQPSIVAQGYYDEVVAFADAVEGRSNRIVSDMDSLQGTYELLGELKRQ